MSTPERRAYKDAWRVRQQTGNASHSVLLDRLSSSGADPVWLDPNGDLHQWLVGCWDRGTPPRRMAVEAVKKVGVLVPRVVRPIREIIKKLR